MISSKPIQSLSFCEEEDVPIAASFAGTLRAFGKKQQLELSRSRPLLAATAAQKLPSTGPAFLPKDTETSAIGKLPQPASGRLLSEKSSLARKRTRPQRSSLLARAWRWLQKQQAFSAKKQLRVCETVSLGEKRFVALVQIESQRFLIGGGASGVSLLAELNNESEQDDSSVLDTKDASRALQPIACAGGRSR
ncbi:MAG TPA: flagellar biosynthetic protein FliO [Edaphobacter sp.]|jgi:hypothetical protein|uniref:flagellar biosynthetic protein FliO n=1 Tax=Edaphobacter sp. TaxID=1934404 RepID=UPI002CF6463B|nr:flagellar biosynthetic protein FliO [Edaphobacter sp.]HUZ94105.1 flagellar biosynthetic protein FliO [Edaphobacter sp.]